MQREFRHLAMTTIRRIAHQPREAKCIAGLLLMQVILVCVAHAAQKAWMKRRSACMDPGGEVMPEEIPASETSEIISPEEDPAYASVIPLRALWDGIAGREESQYGFPGRSCFPGRLRPALLNPVLTTGY
jgi:hypothetical protein